MKKLTALAVLLALLVGIVSGCGNILGTSKPITACVGSEPASIDPAINYSADGGTYLIHAFEGLTKTDKNLNTVAGIAKSWTISKNGLVYTFTLRDDSKWSDGKPVVASDFVYAWQRALNPATGSYYSYQLLNIINATEINSQFLGTDGKPVKAKVDDKGEFVKDDKGNYIAGANGKYVSAKADGSAIWLGDLGAVAVNAHTLKITLVAPCTYFLDLAATPIFFPVRKDIIDAHPTDWANSPKTYIGDGPYVLSSWTHSSKMVFKKNTNYYDKNDIVSNEIDFLLMSDTNTIFTAYKSGKLLVSDNVPTTEIPALLKSGEVKINNSLGTYLYAFNVSKPPFDNEKVRKALNLVIDRQYICDSVVKAGETPAGAFVPAVIPDVTAGKEFRTVGKNYWNATTAGNATNIAAAKLLLADAGYPDGKRFPAVELKYGNNSGNKLIAEQIVSDWKKELGINVNLAPEEWNAFQSDFGKSNYQIAANDYVADYVDPMSFLSLFNSTNGDNFTMWRSTQYNALIADANKSVNIAARMTDLHKAEDILMAQVPIIPIYYDTDPDLVSKNLVGYVNSPLGYKYFMWASVK